MRITVRVQGKPPKKGSGKSIWSNEQQAERVMKLRTAAADMKEKSGVTEPLKPPISMRIDVRSPHITDRKDAPDEYIGDLDSLVAGILDALRPADHNTTPHEMFKRDKRVDPTRPIMFEDDAKITRITAEKRQGGYDEYSVTLEDSCRDCGLLHRIFQRG